MNDSKSNIKSNNSGQFHLKKIIEIIRKHEYVSTGEIVKEVGLSYQELMRYISELEKKGIIIKTQIPTYYTLNDEYRKSK